MSRGEFWKDAIAAPFYPLMGDHSAGVLLAIGMVALPIAGAVHALPSPGVAATAFQIILFLGCIVVQTFFGNTIAYQWHAAFRSTRDGQNSFMAPGYMKGRAAELTEVVPANIIVLAPAFIAVAFFRDSWVSVAVVVCALAALPMAKFKMSSDEALTLPLRYPLAYLLVAASEIVMWAGGALLLYGFYRNGGEVMLGRLSHVPAGLVFVIVALHLYWGFVNARLQGLLLRSVQA